MQIIIVFECLSKNNSDYMYIKATLDHFYNLYRNNIKLTPLSLNGKGNYDSKKAENKIKEFKKRYDGFTIVVYCLDVDKQNQIYNLEINRDIIEYAKKNNFYLIWFNENIEDVYLQKEIERNKKNDEATKFVRNNKIKNVPEDNLSDVTCSRKGTSNFLNIFEQIIGGLRKI